MRFHTTISPRLPVPRHLTSPSRLPPHLPVLPAPRPGWTGILWRWPGGRRSPNCPVGGEGRGLHDRLHSRPVCRRAGPHGGSSRPRRPAPRGTCKGRAQGVLTDVHDVDQAVDRSVAHAIATIRRRATLAPGEGARRCGLRWLARTVAAVPWGGGGSCNKGTVIYRLMPARGGVSDGSLYCLGSGLTARRRARTAARCRRCQEAGRRLVKLQRGD